MAAVYGACAVHGRAGRAPAEEIYRRMHADVGTAWEWRGQLAAAEAEAERGAGGGGGAAGQPVPSWDNPPFEAQLGVAYSAFAQVRRYFCAPPAG